MSGHGRGHGSASRPGRAGGRERRRMGLTQEFRVSTARIVELLAGTNMPSIAQYGTMLPAYVDVPQVREERGW